MAKKKLIDKITSKEFIKAAKSFLIMIIILGVIAVFYLYIAKTVNIEYLLKEAPQISDFKVLKNSIYSGNPIVILSWKTSKSSIATYEVDGGGERLTYRGGKYEKEHMVILPLSYFFTDYRVKISVKDRAGNEMVKDFKIKTSSKDKNIIGEIKVE